MKSERRATRRRGLQARAWALGLGGAIAALAFWMLMSIVLKGGGGVISRLPPPYLVAQDLFAYALDGLWHDLASSLEVFFIGWIIGSVLAAIFGLLIGRIRIFGAMFRPMVEAIRPVSSITWVPLSVVWFGFGLTGKVFLVGLAVFLVVIVYAIDGSRRIPADLERTATMLGMSGWQRFLSLTLPGALSEVLIGARVALMAGWGTVIVAELVAANSGLGAHLIAVQQSYDVSAVLATMICFGAAGFIMNWLFDFLEKRLVPWRTKAGE
ncbi:MAG TPA: ABC transporter permease [Pararhizobium sp.]|nr:ABC transporter permease [Pararhizobium sp.]